jgi:predicted RecA/RadA family phage recombinase
MKNYVQRGENITVAAPAVTGCTSGDLVIVGALFGVAAETAAAGVPVDLVTVGCFALPKVSGAINFGERVCADATGKITTAVDDGGTPTPTAFLLIGVAVAAAGADDATATVRLNGSF